MERAGADLLEGREELALALELARHPLDHAHLRIDPGDLRVEPGETAAFPVTRKEQCDQRQQNGRRQDPAREHLLACQAARLERRRDEVERADAPSRGRRHGQLGRATRLGDLGQVAPRLRRPGRIGNRDAQVEQRGGGGAIARHPDRVALAPACAGEAPPGFRDERRVIGGGEAPAPHEGRALQEQEVDRVACAVQPRDALAAVGLDEGDHLVRGDRDRHRPELRLLGEAQRGFDHAAIGGGDQHTLAFGRRAVGLGLRRQRDEVERRIVRGDRQVPFELELHHLARLSGHGRQLDGLDGDR